MSVDEDIAEFKFAQYGGAVMAKLMREASERCAGGDRYDVALFEFIARHFEAMP